MSNLAVTPVINDNSYHKMSGQPPFHTSTTITSHYTATICANNLSPAKTTVPECGLDLLNMGLLHIRYVFDTGASHTLSPTHVHGSLKSSRPSRLEIIGYHGSDTQFGTSSGILSGCAVGSEIPFTFGTDTIKDLNDPLFSFTDMYERHNFCLSLTQPGDWSGLYRIDPNNGTWIDKIPLYYCGETHQWLLEVIIGKYSTANRVATLIFNRRKCNTKLARELDQASSISPNDVQIVSALASALAMPATTPDSITETYSPDPDECNPQSLTAGRFKSMTQKQLHEILGHFGHLPGCIICLQVKKNLNRIYKNPRPKTDPRPGYTWDLDVIYWSFSGVSERGYRYSIILRDRCTGTPFIVHMATRDESSVVLHNLITDMRNDIRFKQPYPMFQNLNLDLAGEFTGSAFKQSMKSLNIHEIHWRDPIRKEDNGLAEYAVQRMEIAVKKSMAHTGSPPSYFCYHADVCAQIMARLPLTKNISTADYDAIRPLEQLFSFEGKTGFSRTQCDRDLMHINVPGTLVLCTDKDTKGSDLQRIDRCSWGIILGTKGMNQIDIGHLSIIENPFTKTHRHSKSITILAMVPGQNAWSTLGLPTPTQSAKSSVPRSGDESFPAVCIIKLPFSLETMRPNPTISGFKMHDQDFDGEPVLKMFDNSGHRLTTNPQTGHLETGRLALPDILEQLEITEIPNLDSSSYKHAENLLHRRPKDFIGSPVYKYWSEAEPPGQYQGKVVSHRLDKDLGHIWQILWPEIGNNMSTSCDYDEEEMIQYCVNGDNTDLITPDDPRLTEYLDADPAEHFLCLDDFELYLTKDNDNFRQICEQLCLPGPDRHLYFDWLERHFGYGPNDSLHPDQLTFKMPFSTSGKLISGDKFRAKTRFPIPSGSSWMHIKQSHDAASNLQNDEHLAAISATATLATSFEATRLHFKETNYLNLGGCHSMPPSDLLSHANLEDTSISEGEILTVLQVAEICHLDTTTLESQYAKINVAVEKSTSDDNEQTALNDAAVLSLTMLIAKYVPDNPYKNLATGQIVPPKSYSDAQTRSDWPLWKFAVDKELNSFKKLHVHSRKMSIDTVRKEGYRQQPVRSHFIFDSKYDIINGNFLKPKARWVVQGDPNQMTKGVHYFHSYSPAPSTTTTRMLQAVACGYNKTRHACDVETAFLHSDLQPHEQIPIRLPDGMEVQEADGSTLRYVILYKGQYGTPSAGYYWTRTRDAWLLQEFMKPPWHIKQMNLEPCMFVITNTSSKTVSHHLIHVDDIDTISDNNEDVDYIYGQIHKRFGISRCDPGIMLGVERRLTTVANTRYLEFLMPTYIANLHAEWAAKWTELGRPWSDKVPEVPMPVNTILSVAGTEKHPRPSDAEITETMALHMKLTGQLLWLARMCFPDLLFSCSQLSRVLSASGWTALEFGMQMIRYAYSQRNRGIRFRSDGHPKLRAAYDASDNPDPKDGKSSYGFSIHLFDGPLHAISKKTTRVGTSSTHNEYIAQAEMAKCLVYIQNLFIEMGFPEICDEPTPAAGDNYTATTQLAEGRLTERNRFYITDYHYCVEIFERGLFEPYWVRTNDNGADIYTKSVPPPIMKRLRPAETGYSDDPLPAPDMTATPKSTNEPPTTDSTCNRNTWVRLGGCKETSDINGRDTASIQ